MKKVLFTVITGLITLSTQAQITVQPRTYPNLQSSDLIQTLEKNKQAAVDDTITQFFVGGGTCSTSPMNFVIGNSVITGTFSLNDSTTITEVAQVFVAGGEVNVEGALVLASTKEPGANPGSFEVRLYDDTLSAQPGNATGISNAVSISSIDTGNTLADLNRFDFNSPINITDSVFWLGLQVDNGSDTISVFSTNDDCGNANTGVSVFKDNFGNWGSYRGTFQVGANDPLDIALYIWALVDNINTIGLSERFLSKSGISSYPNPTDGLTTIEFDMTDHNTYDLLIQDMTGRTVLNISKSFNNSNSKRQFEVDLSDLPKGAYTYQVVGSTEKRSSVLLVK